MRSMRPPAPASAPTRNAGAWLGALVVAAVAVWVFRGALDCFFAADDFPALARAQGLLPRLQGPWRLLSGQLWFDLLRPLAGLDPRGYHAAGLALHAGCALSLYALLRRRLSTPAALAGAAFFAAHPAHYTALYWVSGIGAPLALLPALGAVAVATRRGAIRWLAVPLFAAALLARESVALLPLGLAALLAWEGRRAGRRERAWRDPLPWALAALALALALDLAFTDVLGTRSGAGAYRLDAGRAALENLLTYLGWSADFLLPAVRRFQDAVDPLAFGWGSALLVAWLGGLASAGLRRRGWAVAGALYLALLGPALPLAHHTYHYYLYAPLAALAWGVAAALDRLFAWRGATGRGAAAAAWGAALVLATLLAWNGAALVRKVETMPFPGSPGLRLDPTVDRARIARRAIADLREAAPPAGTRLAFWSPIGRALAGGGTESYFERNVRAALFEGVAVRVFCPGVDSVRFVGAYRPLPEPWRYAVYRPDGALRIASSATLDSLLAGPAPAR